MEAKSVKLLTVLRVVPIPEHKRTQWLDEKNSDANFAILACPSTLGITINPVPAPIAFYPDKKQADKQLDFIAQEFSYNSIGLAKRCA